MKYINGVPCRRMKTWTGRKYWVRMDPAEVREVYLYRATVCLSPLLAIAGFALAAGLI